MMQFFMPMIPPKTTAQMRKVAVRKGKPVFYDPPAVEQMKAKLTAHLAQHKPEKPMAGPLRLTVKWIWPGPDAKYKPTKPDTDNLQKSFKDICTKLGFWGDDAQVCSEIIEKFTDAKPGIFVQIEQL